MRMRSTAAIGYRRGHEAQLRARCWCVYSERRTGSFGRSRDSSLNKRRKAESGPLGVASRRADSIVKREEAVQPHRHSWQLRARVKRCGPGGRRRSHEVQTCAANRIMNVVSRQQVGKVPIRSRGNRFPGRQAGWKVHRSSLAGLLHLPSRIPRRVLVTHLLGCTEVWGRSAERSAVRKSRRARRRTVVDPQLARRVGVVAVKRTQGIEDKRKENTVECRI